MTWMLPRESAFGPRSAHWVSPVVPWCGQHTYWAACRALVGPDRAPEHADRCDRCRAILRARYE